MENDKLVTITEFCRHHGITRDSIYKALKNGKVTCTVRSGRKFLKLESAKEEYFRNKSKRMAAAAAGEKWAGRDFEAEESGESGEDAEEKFEAPKFEGLTTADAERREKVYKARMAELKYKQQARELIPRDKVEARAFEVARKVRDAITQIPARVCHELAGERDPHRVEVILSKELAEALKRLSTEVNT